ncbi:MAG: hypothetical protein CMO66_00945 [Verrucomicrobiales bacterium]|nr:hypothetical protein [Verrucomicrobiales bacterium]MBR89827.1 hypothetical protein [Verrucomicrobiales bacterium]|tara:strand:+ start:601 stop:900 length:300 start_codon:yes stop_codon:yes gene_type:complete
MNLADVQVIGSNLALKWSGGREQFIELEVLRRACPCASCAGETDVLGNVHKGPEKKLDDTSFQVRQIQPIGGYALQIFWADGHGTGLFSHEYLGKLDEA